MTRMAAVLSVCVLAACAEQPTESPTGADEALYDEALREVFAKIRRPQESLVFPDRFITTSNPEDFDGPTSGVAAALARRYPDSRACEYEACDPVADETLVLVSKIRMLGDDRAEIMVWTSTYFENDVYADAHLVGLVREGGSWTMTELEHVLQY